MIVNDAAGAEASRRVIVYIGDYVDRGLQSREVVDLLLEGPPAGFEAVPLKGNHEDFLLRFLEDASLGPLWMYNGGDATLYSYGVERTGFVLDRGAFAETQAAFRRVLPHRHLEFFRSLRLHHTEGDYFFVHAGVRPGVPLDAQDEEEMLWIRDPFLYSEADYGKVVVHGHTPVAEPEDLANRIDIDTGAFFSGRLTCLVLEGGERRFLQT